jgi:predicted RNase H-like nuclease (RuvC/YqgF family)
MTKEENANRPSDVDNIRKILFGDQVSQIEERFNQNENAISQLRTENRNLRQALEAEVTMRENVNRELHAALEAVQKEQNDTWKKSVSAQAKLISAIEKALSEYSSEISNLSQ